MSTQRRGWEWNPQKNHHLWEMYLDLVPDLQKRLKILEEKVEPPPEKFISLAMKVMFPHA